MKTPQEITDNLKKLTDTQMQDLDDCIKQLNKIFDSSLVTMENYTILCTVINSLTATRDSLVNRMIQSIKRGNVID